MELNRYTFRSAWRTQAPMATTFTVLEDLARYPAWWPEVRHVATLREGAFELTCRSLLPYDLSFVSVQERTDRVAGVLQARLSGDLEGFSSWTITTDGHATTAVFEEEVTATKPLLRRLAPVARPAFRANHALMMRHGRAGLQVYLAGYAAGASGAVEESTADGR